MNDSRMPFEYTLLVASGEAWIYNPVQAALTDAGYIVRLSCDVEETLAAMQSAKPDLLIVDERLPGGGAEELIKRLYCVREMYRFPFLLTVRHPSAIPLWIHTFPAITGAGIYLNTPFNSSELIWLAHRSMVAINDGAFPTPSPVSYEGYSAACKTQG